MRSRPAIALALAVAIASCSSEPRTAGAPGVGLTDGGADVPVTVVPPEIAGLRSRPEDVDALEQEAGPDSYVVDTKLWSLRSGERPRATLQVSRFTTDVDVDDETFRERVVAQIGSSTPSDRTIAGRTVYVTTSNQQGVYVWFAGRYLLVLAVAKEHPAPRELLRAAVGLRP